MGGAEVRHADPPIHRFNPAPASSVQPLAGKIFQDVCTLANLKRLPGHATLMHQGDPAERFFLLISGQVKLHRVTGEGQEHLVEVIRPGQTFAEALLFSQAKAYPVSATALKDSVLVTIEGHHYRKALEDQPQICLAILGTMSIHLHQRLKDIDTLSLANASRRVINFLIRSATWPAAMWCCRCPSVWWPPNWGFSQRRFRGSCIGW